MNRYFASMGIYFRGSRVVGGGMRVSNGNSTRATSRSWLSNDSVSNKIGFARHIRSTTFIGLFCLAPLLVGVSARRFVADDMDVP